MTTIALGIGFAAVQLISLVLFFVVLIKLFKKEGALKGILGLFCGIYTFIWGWMKHKEAALTKVMAFWSVLTVASFVFPIVIFTTGAMELLDFANSFKNEMTSMASEKGLPKISSKKNIFSAKKSKEIKTEAESRVKQSTKRNVTRSTPSDPYAPAAWENGKYTNPNQAVDHWSRELQKQPKSAEAYNNRGVAYYDLKMYQRAIRDYNQAIQLNSEYATAYNNRGNCYYALNEYQKALADFERSLRLDPQYAKAHFNRGLAYYQMDKTDEACVDFRRACDLGDCEALQWAKNKGICE